MNDFIRITISDFLFVARIFMPTIIVPMFLNILVLFLFNNFLWKDTVVFVQFIQKKPVQRTWHGGLLNFFVCESCVQDM